MIKRVLTLAIGIAVLAGATPAAAAETKSDYTWRLTNVEGVLVVGSSTPNGLKCELSMTIYDTRRDKHGVGVEVWYNDGYDDHYYVYNFGGVNGKPVTHRRTFGGGAAVSISQFLTEGGRPWGLGGLYKTVC
jgi:hypothetical protein